MTSVDEAIERVVGQLNLEKKFVPGVRRILHELAGAVARELILQIPGDGGYHYHINYPALRALLPE